LPGAELFRLRRQRGALAGRAPRGARQPDLDAGGRRRASRLRRPAHTHLMPMPIDREEVQRLLAEEQAQLVDVLPPDSPRTPTDTRRAKLGTRERWGTSWYTGVDHGIQGCRGPRDAVGHGLLRRPTQAKGCFSMGVRSLTNAVLGLSGTAHSREYWRTGP